MQHQDTPTMPDDTKLPPPSDAPYALLPAHAPAARNARRARLRLPRTDADHARLTRAVRRGCFVNLPLPARFEVHLPRAGAAEPAWRDTLRLDTPHGPVEIEDGARLIQALTGMHPDHLPAPSSPHRRWLDAALDGRLGATPLAGAALAGTGSATGMSKPTVLRLSLCSARHALHLHARADAATWLGLLQQSAWSYERSAPVDDLHLQAQTPVLLAQHTLSGKSLAALAAGDIIVPDAPAFLPSGEGRIALAGRRLRVRYQGPCSLEVIEVEGKVNSEEMNDHAFAEHGVAQPEWTEEVWDEQEDAYEEAQQNAQGFAEDGEATGEDAEAAYESESEFEAEGESEDGFEAEHEGESEDGFEAEHEGEFADETADDVEAQVDTEAEPEMRATEAAVAQADAAVADEPAAQDPAAAVFAAEEVVVEDEATFAKRNARSDLGDVPVALSFELGRVSLTLDDVRTLGPGVVLPLSGGSPASLAIVVGGRTLGRGEIVDVDGRLGVRVTDWSTQC